MGVVYNLVGGGVRSIITSIIWVHRKVIKSMRDTLSLEMLKMKYIGTCTKEPWETILANSPTFLGEIKCRSKIYSIISRCLLLIVKWLQVLSHQFGRELPPIVRICIKYRLSLGKRKELRKVIHLRLIRVNYYREISSLHSLPRFRRKDFKLNKIRIDLH